MKKKGQKRISKAQKGFVKDFVKTGNATEAAQRNYKVKNRNVARSIGNENLTKPAILKEIKSIAKEIPDALLVETHLDLLKAKEVQRFIFPTRIKDDEIIDMVADAGFKVITIRPSPIGKMAFYSQANSRARKDGLELAYKLKGSFEPDELNLKFSGYSKEQLIDFIMGELAPKK